MTQDDSTVIVTIAQIGATLYAILGGFFVTRAASLSSRIVKAHLSVRSLRSAAEDALREVSERIEEARMQAETTNLSEQDALRQYLSLEISEEAYRDRVSELLRAAEAASDEHNRLVSEAMKRIEQLRELTHDTVVAYLMLRDEVKVMFRLVVFTLVLFVLFVLAPLYLLEHYYGPQSGSEKWASRVMIVCLTVLPFTLLALVWPRLPPSNSLGS